jgi:hypothetical protein
MKHDIKMLAFLGRTSSNGVGRLHYNFYFYNSNFLGGDKEGSFE